MKRRARVSPVEQKLRAIVALGPAVRESAWQAAQATLSQVKAERAKPHAVRLAALSAPERTA